MYVLDRAGRRLLTLDPGSGDLVEIYQFQDRRAVSAVWVAGDGNRLILAGHDPYPAIVVDRQWKLLAGTPAVGLLTARVAPSLLEPPANVLRSALYPDGMAPDILNFGQWREHLLDRLVRQIAHNGDAEASRTRIRLFEPAGWRLKAVVCVPDVLETAVMTRVL